jgi:hypothetical protein
MRRTLIGFALLAAALGAPAPAAAIDHKNLDEGRPLRVQDAYSIATGEVAVELGAGATVPRRGLARGLFPASVLWGAFPNFQLELGTTLSTSPREIDEQAKSGDLRLGALYNFNQETLTLPAFGAALEVNLPTGVDSSGVDVELKGLVTKSFGRLSLHGNAAYEFLNGTERGERDGRYELVLGASYPIGAPRYTRATLIGDVFTEQSVRHGELNTVGVEAGVRYQLTPRIVWDAGVGTEVAGPGDRSRFFFTTGASFGF